MPSPPLASHTYIELAAIIGSDDVRVTEDSILVAPGNTATIAEVVRYAKQRGLTIGTVGGGTKQRWAAGNTPDILISLGHLNQVLEHAYQDLTCTVQAGCTWNALQATLAQHGQFVALDPLYPDQATVGGILATNDSGALRQRYGSLRDLVIGMTLVLADGTTAKSGGKVVKNVAGYDLCKLMTGSYGTLAIITEATFRLHPLPQHHHTFTVVTDEAIRLTGLIAAIRSSHLLTQSLQIRRHQNSCALDIRLNAHPEAKQDSIFDQIVRLEGLSMQEESEVVWGARESLAHDKATVLRVSTLPTDICRYVDYLQKRFSSNKIISVSQAIGLHDVALHGDPEHLTSIVSELRREPSFSNTTVSVREPGSLKNVQTFEVPAPATGLMKAVKQQFDPDNILNPGRLFPGA